MGGAFQTSRDIFSNPIWQDVIKFRLFFFIVGNAVFSEEGVKQGPVIVQRGQFLRSYRNLAMDLEYYDNRSLKRYSISVLKKKIDQLVKEERLKVEDTELGTLFSVVNYATYQDFGHYKNANRERGENGARTGRERGENNNKNVKNVKKDNNKSSRHKYEICDMENAEVLLKEILVNNPEFKKPNLDMWANEFRLMRERDLRTDEQVKYLIKWVQSDNFWKTNILSPGKLRKQYDSLVIKIKAERDKKKQGDTGNKLRKEDFNLHD